MEVCKSYISMPNTKQRYIFALLCLRHLELMLAIVSEKLGPGRISRLGYFKVKWHDRSKAKCIKFHAINLEFVVKTFHEHVVEM